MKIKHQHIFKSFISLLILFVIFILFSGCQATTHPSKEVTPTDQEALSPLPTLPVKGAAHYVLDSEASEIRILVYRGGPLAKFGHNHVMQAKQLTGDIYLAPEFHNSAFILQFSVKNIVIDSPDARAEEGEDFSILPSAEAIDGTRKNMLGPDVLDEMNYPDISIRSVSITGNPSKPEAKIQIILHGVTREFSTPVTFKRYDNSLITSGNLDLRTSDFNITPFSVLGGGLQVQDQVTIKFHIKANEA